MQDFEARNELEKRLLALHEGELDEAGFIQGLLTAEVFMPIQDDKLVAGVQTSNRARPLVVEAEDGTPVLLLFTSPERAKPVVSEFEGFGGGLLTEFTWVLEKLEGNAGVSLNPGWELGYDIEPGVIAQLLKDMRQTH